jgi:hypothetical protein
MSVYQYGGSVIEISILSDQEDDGWAVEVWDLTPGTGGELAHFYAGAGGRLTIDLLASRHEVEFVLWVIDVVQGELRSYR